MFGEAADPLKPGVLVVGDATCDGGVGLLFGDAVDWARLWLLAPMPFPTKSTLGAMLDADLRAPWCRLNIARCMGGGCTMFCGICDGPRLGLPVFA